MGAPLSHHPRTSAGANFPHGFAQHLDALLDRGEAPEDVHRHLALLDVFARYLLYIPLARYVQLMADGAGRQGLADSRAVCRSVTEALGRRGSLTPYTCVELSRKLSATLADAADPLGQDALELHRQFGLSKSGKRDDVADEVERLFRHRRNEIAHVHYFPDADREQEVCKQWRDHLARWVRQPFFERVRLRCRTTSGDAVSWHPRDEVDQQSLSALQNGTECFHHVSRTGDEVTFPAAPWIRAVVRGDRPSAQFLSEYEERRPGAGEIRYTDCGTQRGMDGGPMLERTTVAGALRLPWTQLCVSRVLVGTRLVSGHGSRMTLVFVNGGAEPAKVRAFTEILPEGVQHLSTGEPHVTVPAFVVSPGQRIEIPYPVVAHEAWEGSRGFRTKRVEVEHGNLMDRVPIDTTSRLECAATVPSALSSARTLTRWNGAAWIVLGADEKIWAGEEVQAELRIENAGTDLLHLELDESLPSRAEPVVTLAEVVDAAGEVSEATVGTRDDRTCVGFDLTQPFAKGGVLTLRYRFYVRKAGEIKIRTRLRRAATAVGVLDREVSSVQLAPDRPLGVGGGQRLAPPVVTLLTAERESSGRGGARLHRLTFRVENPGRHVLVAPQIRVRAIKGAAHDVIDLVPVAPMLRGLTSAEVAVVLPQLEHDPRRGAQNTAIDVGYSTFAGEARLESGVLGSVDGSRLWRPPARIDGFQGRDDVIAEALRRLEDVPAMPLFLVGEPGSGKARFVALLAEVARSRGTDVRLERLRCIGQAFTPLAELRFLARTLCERALEGVAGAPHDVDAVTAASGVLQLRESGPERFAVALLSGDADYARSRDSDGIVDDFVLVLDRFARFRLAQDVGATRPDAQRRLLLVLEGAAALSGDAGKLLRAASERLRARSGPIDVILVDSLRPARLEGSTRLTRVRPWTLDEFAAFCAQCFIEPPLARRVVEDVHAHAGGRPRVAVKALAALQTRAEELLEEHEGAMRWRTGEFPEDLTPDLEADAARKLADFLGSSETKLEADLRTAIALINSVHGWMDRREILDLLGKVVPRDRWDVREGLLARIEEAGWVSSERGTLFGALSDRARRAVAAAADGSPSRHVDALLLHHLDRDAAVAAKYLAAASSEVRRRVAPALVAAASDALHRDEDAARVQEIVGFPRDALDDLPVALRVDALYLRTMAEVKLRKLGAAADSAAALSAARAEGYRDRSSRPRVSTDDVEALLALVAVQVSLSAGDADKGALDALLRWTCAGTLGGRIRRTLGQAGAIPPERFEHHLTALEGLFLGSDVERCAVLHDAFEAAHDRLPWRRRLDYLETCWRLSEHSRTAGILARTRPPPTQVLGEIVDAPSPLARLVDAPTLLERSRRIHEDSEVAVPLWLGRCLYLSWKQEWTSRDQKGRDVPHLIERLRESIRALESAGATEMLARARHDLGAALRWQWSRSGPDERLRTDAVLALREAARDFQRVGRALEAARSLAETIGFLLESDADAARLRAEEGLREEVELALASHGLHEEEVAELRTLLVELAYHSEDVALANASLSGGEVLSRASGIAYMLRRRRAEEALEAGTVESALEARELLNGCLAGLTTTAARRGDRAGRRQVEIRAEHERPGLFVLLAACHRILGDPAGALRWQSEALAIAARHAAVPSPAGLPACWSSVLPACGTIESVVLQLLEAVLESWSALAARGSPPTAEEVVAFFRNHLLRQARSAPVLDEAWSRVAAVLPAAGSPLDAIDAGLLRCELDATRGRPVLPAFLEVSAQLRALDLERGSQINRIVRCMNRVLHLTLSAGLPFDTVLEGLRLVMARRRYGERAIERLTSEMLASQMEAMALHRSGDAERARYLEHFVARALELLDETDLRGVTPEAAGNLVRLCQLVPGHAAQALRCLEELARDSIEQEDEHALLSCSGFLCVTIKRLRESSPDAKPGEREDALLLVRKLIDDSLAPDTWISTEFRQHLAFDVVEKLLTKENRDLLFATGVVLDALASREMAYVRLAGEQLQFARPQDLAAFADGHRLAWVLRMMRMARYGAPSFPIFESAVRARSLFIEFDDWRIRPPEFFAPFAGSSAVAIDAAALGAERRVLSTMARAIELQGESWRLRQASAIMGTLDELPDRSFWEVDFMQVLIRHFLGRDEVGPPAAAWATVRELVANPTALEAEARRRVDMRHPGARVDADWGAIEATLDDFEKLGRLLLDDWASAFRKRTLAQLLLEAGRRVAGDEPDELLMPEDVVTPEQVGLYWQCIANAAARRLA